MTDLTYYIHKHGMRDAPLLVVFPPDDPVIAIEEWPHLIDIVARDWGNRTIWIMTGVCKYECFTTIEKHAPYLE